MKKYDVLILGSGPAGNTAGIYLARSGFKVAIIAGNELGGQLITTTEIENFPAFPVPIKGRELMNLMLLQSQKLGVDIIYDVVEKVNFSINPFICIGEDGEEYAGKNIVIATGAKPKYLGISGEKEYIGYGVSTCATCDGNFFKNKTVAVVGGGNVAAIEALHLTHLASKVCVIYRKSEFFRVEDPILERLNKADNIEFLFDSEVEEIIGVNEPKKVTGVKIFNIKNQKHDILNLDGVFVAIGREPNTNIFKDSGLQLNEKNYIITKPNSAKTNMGGIYAVGDVSDKGFRQAIVASGWGCVAALEIAESII